jgi:hypothetical protein
MSVIERWIVHEAHGPVVIDNADVAAAYIAHGSKVEGPFVPAEQLQGAVEALQRIAQDAEALAVKGEQISTTWVAAGIREALDMLRGQ